MKGGYDGLLHTPGTPPLRFVVEQGKAGRVSARAWSPSHARFVESHEVDLGGGSAFNRREKHFVVSLAKKLELLRSLVHEDAVQMTRVQRSAGKKRPGTGGSVKGRSWERRFPAAPGVSGQTECTLVFPRDRERKAIST